MPLCARSSLCLETSMPAKVQSVALGVVTMALSCECERPARPRGRGSSVGCSGEATRDRLGPCLVAAVCGRGTIGRGPVVVPAWLLAALVVPQARREVVESIGGVLNIQGH